MLTAGVRPRHFRKSNSKVPQAQEESVEAIWADARKLYLVSITTFP